VALLNKEFPKPVNSSAQNSNQPKEVKLIQKPKKNGKVSKKEAAI